MMTDIKDQKAASTNQIKYQKSNVEKSESLMSGFCSGSFNAGHDRPIAYSYYMAGEKIRNMTWESKIKLLTPKTPSYQRLFLTAKTFFVPYTRVFKNYEEFAAQKGGGNETKIQHLPTLTGKLIPNMTDDSVGAETQIFNTLWWRDSFTSFYIPRTQTLMEDSWQSSMPFYDACPLRAVVAIRNDFLRNKEYDYEWTEYDDDEVSEEEWQSYFPTTTGNFYKLKMRAMLPDSYYTNYRTEVAAYSPLIAEVIPDNNYLLSYWTNYENFSDYVRMQAETAMKNDWDIVAELRGAPPALEGKVQLIGKKTIPLNYSAVTQNAYSNASGIEPQFKALGTQGAYSYTEIKVPLVEYFEGKEDGIIITIATVWAETAYTSAFNRQSLNISAKDRYRPDLADAKIDIMYRIEGGTNYKTQAEEIIANKSASVIGFKRKFSELFKLPDCICSGDLLQNGYYRIDYSGDALTEPNYIGEELIPNNTFTFFENSRYDFIDEANSEFENTFVITKKFWLDYSDLMLDKNQAVKSEKCMINVEGSDVDYIMNGHNQIYHIGKITKISNLPIDEAIKNDFTKWGEH